jgi:hypothetical protein
MGDIFGPITPPVAIPSTGGSPLFTLLNRFFVLITTIAGIFFIFQIIASGFTLLSASGDPKKVEQATSRMIQSIIGLGVIASAFLIASIVGRILNIDILNPQVFGPST